METATCELPMAGLDLRTTMMLQRLGRHDPTAHETTGLFEKRHLRTDGAVAFTRIQTDPETCRVTVEGQGAANEVDAWRLALAAVPKWPALPEDARLVRRLGASYPGMRILRMPWVFDVAISCVLQQRVRFVDAVRDYGRIAKQLAPPEVEAPAPAPSPAFQPPADEDLRALWKKVVDSAQTTDVRLGGLLRDSKAKRVGDDKLQVEVASSFHEGKLNEAKNKALIEEIASEVIAAGTRIEVAVGGGGSGGGRRSSGGGGSSSSRSKRGRDWYEERVLKNPLVGQVLEEFDARVLRID